MARKRMLRELPALADLVPGFRGFAAEANHRVALTAVLRRAAKTLVRSAPRPFYAHRDLAAFFRVAPRTVTAACRELVRDGVLVCRRGSGTMLAGRRRTRGTLVRGVIGIPVWVDGFAWFADWRLFFTLLEERLRQAGFAPDVILWRGPENRRPDFGVRLLRHQFDHVIWFTPDRSFLHVIQALDECAIPQTVVGDTHAVGPFQRYSLSWDDAVREGFAAWRRAGVDEVIVGRTQSARQPTYWLAELLRGLGLSHKVMLLSARTPIEEYLHAVRGGPRTGFVFDDQYLPGNLAQRAPEGFAASLREGRVMLLRSMDLPAWQSDGLRVDAALVNWRRLVNRIVSDLANASLPPPDRPRVVAAEWRPGTAVSELSAGLYGE